MIISWEEAAHEQEFQQRTKPSKCIQLGLAISNSSDSKKRDGVLQPNTKLRNARFKVREQRLVNAVSIDSLHKVDFNDSIKLVGRRQLLDYCYSLAQLTGRFAWFFCF